MSASNENFKHIIKLDDYYSRSQPVKFLPDFHIYYIILLQRKKHISKHLLLQRMIWFNEILFKFCYIITDIMGFYGSHNGLSRNFIKYNRVAAPKTLLKKTKFLENKVIYCSIICSVFRLFCWRHSSET